MARRGHGEGTIAKRGDGRWVGAVSLEGGKRKWAYGETRKEVQDKVAAVKRDVEAGLPVAPEHQTLGEYLAKWLETITKCTCSRGSNAKRC
jgi:integrase